MFENFVPDSDIRFPNGITRVGHHAAAATISPVTQANLRTFHAAGTANVLGDGIPRLRSLLYANAPDLVDFAKRMGVAAARDYLVAQLVACLGRAGAVVAPHNLHLIADRMTMNGYLQPCTFGGLKADIGPLRAAAFMKPLEVFRDAALGRKVDGLHGTTERIMTGNL